MAKSKVIAYGFDRIGFKIPKDSVKFRDLEVEFLYYKSTKIDWKKVVGIIVPNGIFEIHQRYETLPDETLLLEFESRVHNLIAQGRWICFLMNDRVVTERPNEIYHTDLAKKIIRDFNITVWPVDHPRPISEIDNTIRSDFFRNYLKDYGVAKNRFKPLAMAWKSISKIAASNDNIWALEMFSSVFFLPFHSANKDVGDFQTLVTTLLKSILDYRKVKLKELPAWVLEFQFDQEVNLKKKIQSLQDELELTLTDLTNWQDYKLVLTTVGENLRQVVIKIFTDFYQFSIDPLDNQIEDFKLLNPDGSILAFCEVKGTKRGIKREYINQVDSHRERNDLDSKVPGILIINNEIGITSIAKRLETTVPEEHIKHAKILNVLIVRTIDLLFLMKQHKPEQQENIFQKYIGKGGWLKASQDKIEFVQPINEK